MILHDSFSPTTFHPETKIFLLPLDGGGKGGADKDLNPRIFLFNSPSPQPSPAGGEGVSGWKLTIKSPVSRPPFEKGGLGAFGSQSFRMKFLQDITLGKTTHIIKAQSARGVNFESGNPLRRAKNIVLVLAPLFTAFSRGRMTWPLP